MTEPNRDIELTQRPDGSWAWRVFDTCTGKTIRRGDRLSSAYAANLEAEGHLNDELSKYADGDPHPIIPGATINFGDPYAR